MIVSGNLQLYHLSNLFTSNLKRIKSTSFYGIRNAMLMPCQSKRFFPNIHAMQNKNLNRLDRKITYIQQNKCVSNLFAKQYKPIEENVKSLIKTRMGIEKMESYGGLSSECYGIWFPENQNYEDANLYEKYIQNQGQPALELGCGDGRLLIPYVKKGLQVEGVDLSPHMIERCRKKAEKHGLKLNLYQQAMQHLSLPKQYGTIFIPFGSFMLVHEEKEALEALKRFYLHLKPQGSLLISLFIPTECDIHVSAPIQNEWRLRREGVRANGNIVQCWEKAVFDLDKQIEFSEYRYDVLDQGQIISTEYEALKLRWYTQEQFHNLLKGVGFNAIKALKEHSGEIASQEDNEFTFVCQKP